MSLWAFSCREDPKGTKCLLAALLSAGRAAYMNIIAVVEDGQSPCSVLIHFQQHCSQRVLLGPVHTGRGASCNMCVQIMEHTAVNGSVHTGCKQQTRVCRQICSRVLYERGEMKFGVGHPNDSAVDCGRRGGLAAPSLNKILDLRLDVFHTSGLQARQGRILRNTK